MGFVKRSLAHLVMVEAVKCFFEVGRMSQAIRNTFFIFLTNKKFLTFNQKL